MTDPGSVAKMTPILPRLTKTNDRTQENTNIKPSNAHSPGTVVIGCVQRHPLRSGGIFNALITWLVNG